MDRKIGRICTICARGGSEGVKGKNIRPLLGKPLIVYSIEQARQSKLFYAIAVSSDSDEILAVAKQAGADYMVKRPSGLAKHTSPKLPAIRHCVETVEHLSNRQYQIVVDLDATSPLRDADDIIKAVALLEKKDVSNVITGTPARRSPYFNLVELADNGTVCLSKQPLKSVTRRQDSPQCFDMNASIYVWKRDALFNKSSLFNKDTLLYVMPQERSFDLDGEVDFIIIERLMEHTVRKSQK